MVAAMGVERTPGLRRTGPAGLS